MAKTPKNEMKLSFPSLSENERLARIAISGFVSLYNPRLDELTDIKTAVSEAVTNAIVHAYRGSFGTVELTARIYDGGLVYIKIKDKGCGIDCKGDGTAIYHPPRRGTLGSWIFCDGKLLRQCESDKQTAKRHNGSFAKEA